MYEEEKDLIEVWVLLEWGWKRVAFFHTKQEAVEFGWSNYPKTVIDLIGPSSKLA